MSSTLNHAKILGDRRHFIFLAKIFRNAENKDFDKI